MGRPRRIAIDLFVMAAIGAVLGLVGPFDSGAMPTAPRLFFWVTFILVGYAIFRPLAAVSEWVTAETRIPAWLAIVLTATVAALPLAGLVAFALSGMKVTDFWFGNRFALLYAQVALVGIGIHLLMLLVAKPKPGEAPEEETPATHEAARDETSPFLRRLPPALGRDLLSLQMQDHYVRAETALGGTLVLMRFRDAVAELRGLGLQVHRSWWAAYGAMEAMERDGRSARLRLRGGAVLPVSRAFLPAVREALDRRAAGFDSEGRSYKSRAGSEAALAPPQAGTMR
jgi:hypothetical protein